VNQSILNHIRIVLVETTHPGNIGAAARSMKSMGFINLHLVQPKYFPHAEATARAAGADDILENARLHDSLSAALKDCVMVFGTSARLRNLSCPVVDPDEAVVEILDFADNGSPLAIVFGRESSGMTNEELDRCNKMIIIPTSDNFSSLNLASAVQIMCYELFKAITVDIDRFKQMKGRVETVTNEELNKFYEHLQECLLEIGFLDPDRPRKLMRRLKQLFNRAVLDQNEYNILRGILTAVQESLRQK
jgi:TrmH family RNA methyltransferase